MIDEACYGAAAICAGIGGCGRASVCPMTLSNRRSVLLTGFEPFWGEEVNPSSRIAASLHGTLVAGHPVVGLTLPVEFGVARRRLRAAIKAHDPVMVLCLGVARRRTAISLERVAINVDDAAIPDNGGRQPRDQPIVQRGPVAYWSTLPLRAMAAAIERVGVPVELSTTAGTYVCNHVFYGLMHAIRARRDLRGGFVHVPRERADLSVGKMSEAIAAALAAVLAHDDGRRRDRLVGLNHDSE